jgi:hypothetical protein
LATIAEPLAEAPPGKGLDGQDVQPAREPGAIDNTLAAASLAVGTFGTLACWLDRATYGNRLKIVGALGAVVWAAGYFEGLETAYVPSVFLCTAVTYLLVLARIWWIRGDDGRWTWDCFKARIRAVVADTVATFADREESSLASALPKLISASAVSGVLLIALAPTFTALVTESLWWSDRFRVQLLEVVEGLERFGGWCLWVAAALGVFEYLRRKQPSAKTDAFKQGAKVVGSQADLPPVLDVWDTEYSIPTELSGFVSVLAEWKPRMQETEDGYERSLKRHLQKMLPGSLVENQKPIKTNDGRPAELDVVVDNSIVIELKKDLRVAAEMDRAIGQLARYASSWHHGPILLLVCETDSSFSSSPVVQRVNDLRRIGHSVLIAAAGRRL